MNKIKSLSRLIIGIMAGLKLFISGKSSANQSTLCADLAKKVVQAVEADAEGLKSEKG